MSKQYSLQLLYLFICLEFFGATARAGDTVGNAAIKTDKLAATVSDEEQALARVRENVLDVERRWYGLSRIRISYPQTFSAGLGAIFVEQPKDQDCATVCMMRGWHVEVEPGIHGLQAGLGYGKLVGETGRSHRLMQAVYYAWGVRGVALRTWGDSPLEPEKQTLAGVEGNFSVVRLNFSLALMRRLSSGPSDEWVVTGGVGWGF